MGFATVGGRTVAETQQMEFVVKTLQDIEHRLAQLESRQAKMEFVLLHLLPADFENGGDYNAQQN